MAKLSGYRTLITLAVQMVIIAFVQRGYLSEEASSEAVVSKVAEGVLLLAAQALSLKGMFWRLKAERPGPLSHAAKVAARVAAEEETLSPGGTD